jgi:hypothetical protein
MTAGIVLDSWKLPFFKKVLDRACFQYTEHPGVVAGEPIVTLKVGTKTAKELTPFVEEANTLAANSKLN